MEIVITYISESDDFRIPYINWIEAIGSIDSKVVAS